MARGQLLSSVRALLKAELREAQETNSTLDAEFNYALANKQKDLALAYDWSFLKHDWDLSAGVGSRYLNIPTSDTRAQSVAINFERPVCVTRKWGTVYEEVDYGIGYEQYSIREGTSQLLDPILRWQLVTNSNEASNPDQVEIWPSPATSQTLRFTGQRVVQSLSADSDKADLDDLLLVYFVAADYFLLREATNASLALKKASDHLMKLRASYPRTDQEFVFGGEMPGREKIKLVAIA